MATRLGAACALLRLCDCEVGALAEGCGGIFVAVVVRVNDGFKDVIEQYGG